MDNIVYSNLLNFVFANQDLLHEIKEQYLGLLSMLTHVESMSDEAFTQKLMEITNMGEIIVCLYGASMKIIGTGTIIYEPKMIHGGSSVGHIEDVVIHESYRKMGLAQEILHRLEIAAAQKGCYKVILDCDMAVESVYLKAGFIRKGVQMAKYAV